MGFHKVSLLFFCLAMTEVFSQKVETSEKIRDNENTKISNLNTPKNQSALNDTASSSESLDVSPSENVRFTSMNIRNNQVKNKSKTSEFFLKNNKPTNTVKDSQESQQMKAQSTVQYATSTNNWRPPGLRQNYQEQKIYQGLRPNDESAMQQFSEEKDLHPRLIGIWGSSPASKTNKIIGESQQSVPAIPKVITESRSFITNPQISSTHLNYSPASYEASERPEDLHNRGYSSASGSAERYSSQGEPDPPHHVHTETTHDYGRFLAEDYRSKIEKEAEELIKRQKAHNSTHNGKSGPNIQQQGYSHPKQGGSSYHYTGGNNDHMYSNNYNRNPHHYEVTSTELPYHTPRPVSHSVPVTAPYSMRQPTVSPGNMYSPYSHAPQGTSTPYRNLPQKYSNVPQQPSSPQQNLPSQYLNVPRQPNSPHGSLPSQYSSGPTQPSVTHQNMPSHYSDGPRETYSSEDLSNTVKKVNPNSLRNIKPYSGKPIGMGHNDFLTSYKKVIALYRSLGFFDAPSIDNVQRVIQTHAFGDTIYAVTSPSSIETQQYTSKEMETDSYGRTNQNNQQYPQSHTESPLTAERTLVPAHNAYNGHPVHPTTHQLQQQQHAQALNALNGQTQNNSPHIYNNDHILRHPQSTYTNPNVQQNVHSGQQFNPNNFDGAKLNSGQPNAHYQQQDVPQGTIRQAGIKIPNPELHLNYDYPEQKSTLNNEKRENNFNEEPHRQYIASNYNGKVQNYSPYTRSNRFQGDPQLRETTDDVKPEVYPHLRDMNNQQNWHQERNYHQGRLNNQESQYPMAPKRPLEPVFNPEIRQHHYTNQNSYPITSDTASVNNRGMQGWEGRPVSENQYHGQPPRDYLVSKTLENNSQNGKSTAALDASNRHNDDSLMQPQQRSKNISKSKGGRSKSSGRRSNRKSSKKQKQNRRSADEHMKAQAATYHWGLEKHKDTDGFFQYANVPKAKSYEYGYRIGGPEHTVERYHKTKGIQSKIKVNWEHENGDSGDQYWEFNHDSSEDDGESDKPEARKAKNVEKEEKEDDDDLK